MPSTISDADARRDFADVLRRAEAGELTVVTRDGRPAAAVVPLDVLDALDALEDRLDHEAGTLALREAEERGTMRWEDFERTLDQGAPGV